jgi:hypothetical protein
MSDGEDATRDGAFVVRIERCKSRSVRTGLARKPLLEHDVRPLAQIPYGPKVSRQLEHAAEGVTFHSLLPEPSA